MVPRDVAQSPYDVLCDLATRRGWHVELYTIAGLLRLAATDETGIALSRPVRFDTADRDGSALTLLERIPAC